MPPRIMIFVSALRRTVGWGLVAIGLVYLVIFSLVTMGLGIHYFSQGEDITSHISHSGIAGPFITGTLLLVAGMILREGKKYSVLFLRPFNSIANEKAMNAFSRKLGRRLTVVALDDGSIPPPKWSVIRALVALFVYVPASLVLFFVGALVMPIGESEFATNFPSILALSAAIFLVRAAWRGAVQPQKRLVVDSAQSLTRAVNVSRAQSTWGLRVLFPRVIFIKTNDDMWKAAVAEICNVATLAIIDVSRYSESIDWEVRFLHMSKPTRSLVITSLDGPPPPDQCGFAGPIEKYATSPDSDGAFETRVLERLERMLP